MEVCKICGCSYKRITASHLKKHNITKEEYLRLYKKEEYKELKVTEFLKDNYISVSDIWKFIIYPVGETSAKTVKIDKDSKRKFPLGEADIKRHLRAGTTVGVYTSILKTKLIAFDIDINSKADGQYKDIANCLAILEVMVDKLYTYGITEEYVLCSFSGSKGYHIDIFLEDAICVDTAKKFQELVDVDVFSDVSSDVKKGVIIEHRGSNGQAYKLPLGYHQKTRNKCYICNEYGVEMDDLVCLTKKKLNGSVIEEAVSLNYNTDDVAIFNKIEKVVNSVKLLDMHTVENEDRRKKVGALLHSGTRVDKVYISNNVRDSSRSFLLYEVALYLKFVECMDEDQALVTLQSWVKNYWDKTLVDAECVEHIKSTLKSAYRKGRYFDNATKEFNITREHMREILSIDVKHKQKNLALRKLYFILIIHSNYFADSKSGEFKMANSVMERMGAVKNNRSLLKKQLEELQRLGKIEIVSSSIRKAEYEKDKLFESNVYKIAGVFTKIAPDDGVVRHCKGVYNCKECMLICSSTLLDRRLTTSFISLKDYKKYKDSCPNKG